MNKKIIISLIILAVVIAFFIFKDSRDSDTIKIGALFTLTGPQTTFGEAQQKSALMAVKEVNAKGGIDGRKVELFMEDSASDPKKAIDGYHILKNKGVKIFDVEGSPIAVATKDLIVGEKYFMLSSGATTPLYSDGSDLSCRMTATAKNIGPTHADYAIKNGYKRISVLAPNNEYGKGLADELSNSIIAKGGSIVIEELYDASNINDFRTSVTKIKSKQGDIDAMFAINAATSAQHMFKQINDMGWDKPILSDYNTMLNIPADKLSLVNGVEFIDWDYSSKPRETDSAVAKEFKERYFAEYGKNPSLLDAGYYDGVKTILNAIEAVGDDPKDIGEYISNLKNYNVTTGVIKSFNTDCDAQRDLIFRVVADGVFVDVKN